MTSIPEDGFSLYLEGEVLKLNQLFWTYKVYVRKRWLKSFLQYYFCTQFVLSVKLMLSDIWLILGLPSD